MTPLEQLLGLKGMASLVPFIPWTKVAIGAALTLAAIFVPPRKHEKTAPTRAASLANGALRLGLVFAGMILLVGAMVNGHEKHDAAPATKQARNQELKGGTVETEQMLQRPNAQLEEPTATANRTRVRSGNGSSPVETSSSGSNSRTNATANSPSPKWKFLHK